MSDDIFVVVEHHQGEVHETTNELLAKAKELAGQTGGQAVAVLLGSGAGDLAGGLAADRVLSVDHAAFEHFLPEAYVATLQALIDERSPRLTLIANTTVGMELAGSLAARTSAPLAAYCIDLAMDGDEVVATCQVFGGKLHAEVAMGTGLASVVAGSFPAAEGGGAEVEDVAAPGALDSLSMRFLARIEPDNTDVDITGEELLVSIGRGIGGAENVELAEELAEALGATVSASRPVADAGWLPKTRQVGKSGRKVKPKLYLACGISGAPEHLEGMRDADLIIAINTDENAPIFDVAHYGTTEDLFDVLPAITERVESAAPVG